MPLYEYECEACKQRFEVIQKFSDPMPDTCARCGKGPVRRLISTPAIQFKGSGWYITDYAGGRSSAASSTGSSDSSDSKGEAKTESKGEAKESSKPAGESSAKGDSSSSSSAPSTPSTSATPKSTSKD